MPSYYTYSTPVEIATGFSDTVVGYGGTTAIGSTIDNTSDKWTHLDLMLSLWFVSAPESGNVRIGMRYSIDGTTWESISSMLIVDCLFVPAGSVQASPYIYMLRDIRILPYYFAIGVKNLAQSNIYVTISGRARKMVFELA